MAVFIRDTRDKIGKHDNVDSYLTAQGHKIVRSKMFVGDVALLNNQSICIDLKQNLIEVSGNLWPDKTRFVSELNRAKDAGIKLIILIEDDSIKTRSDLFGWVNPHPNRTAMTPNGERIYKTMRVLSGQYGAEFRFCQKKETGAEVIRLLAEGVDNGDG